MNRRDVIKGLGLSFGALLITPSAMSLLQSCTEQGPAWTPKYFKAEQASFISKVVDIILPKTDDAPSATEVNVPEFIDKYVGEIFETEERDMLIKGFANFGNKVLKSVDVEALEDLKPNDIETVLATILKKTKQEDEAIMTRVYGSIENKTEILDDDLTYAALGNIRNLCIFAYKNSERVGEEILTYTPVPGKQEGCIDISATNGKAYSL